MEELHAVWALDGSTELSSDYRTYIDMQLCILVQLCMSCQLIIGSADLSAASVGAGATDNVLVMSSSSIQFMLCRSPFSSSLEH